MNLLYELLYLTGLRPWERGGIPAALRELVEGPEALPPGRALDVGCGTGGPTVYLASRGWQVTAVDVIARALRQARVRATAAGVSPRFVEADVTRLPEDAAVPGGYGLVLDSGCYHGLDEGRRAAFAATVTRLAAPRAAMLLFALTPGGAARPRAFRGAGRDEIAVRFEPGWELVRQRAHEGPSLLRGVGQFWYLLRRRATA